MKKTVLYSLWAMLYVICAVLGYCVPEPSGLQSFALIALSFLFFVPPVLLRIDAHRQKDQKTKRLLRWVSGASVALTMILLVANLLSALGSQTLGDVLYVALAVVSAPMLSSQQGFLSVFLWACLFFASLDRKEK